MATKTKITRESVSLNAPKSPAEAVGREAHEVFSAMYNVLFDVYHHAAVQDALEGVPRNTPDNERERIVENAIDEFSQSLRSTIGDVLTILFDHPAYIYEIKPFLDKLEEERNIEECKEIDYDILVNAR